MALVITGMSQGRFNNVYGHYISTPNTKYARNPEDSSASVPEGISAPRHAGRKEALSAR
jgi:hypothetical protein